MVGEPICGSAPDLFLFSCLSLKVLAMVVRPVMKRERVAVVHELDLGRASIICYSRSSSASLTAGSVEMASAFRSEKLKSERSKSSDGAMLLSAANMLSLEPGNR